MKNTLAENLLRFGVKNLSEAEKKKIEESLLTEGIIDLSKTPGIDKVNKYFEGAMAKRVPRPAAFLGEYYLLADPVDYTNKVDLRLEGPVIGFKIYSIPGLETQLPLLPDFVAGEGGQFDWSSSYKTFNSITWDTSGLPFDPKTKTDVIVDGINRRMNSLPLQTLQQIYAISARKPKGDQLIAAFKASNSPIKTMLTGNAKAFFGV